MPASNTVWLAPLDPGFIRAQTSTRSMPCPAARHTILKNGAAIATTSNKSFVVTGLAPATSYNFTVTARDLFGPSKASAILKIKTLAKSGSGPSGGGSSCAAAWNASAVYLAGATASVAGVNYKANWWTQGNNPTTSSGPAGSGQPWTAAAPAPPARSRRRPPRGSRPSAPPTAAPRCSGSPPSCRPIAR